METWLATFSNCGEVLKAQATAASRTTTETCSRRGNAPPDGNNAWACTNGQSATKPPAPVEGTQTERERVAGPPRACCLIYSRSPPKGEPRRRMRPRTNGARRAGSGGALPIPPLTHAHGTIYYCRSCPSLGRGVAGALVVIQHLRSVGEPAEGSLPHPNSLSTHCVNLKNTPPFFFQPHGITKKKAPTF